MVSLRYSFIFLFITSTSMYASGEQIPDRKDYVNVEVGFESRHKRYSLLIPVNKETDTLGYLVEVISKRHDGRNVLLTHGVTRYNENSKTLLKTFNRIQYNVEDYYGLNMIVFKGEKKASNCSIKL